MGLRTNFDPFSERAFDMLRPSIAAAMDAVVDIYDPNLKSSVSIDFDTGKMVVAEGVYIARGAAARITPVRGANLRGSMASDAVQRVQVQLLREDLTGEPHQGYIVHVKSASLNPHLVGRRMPLVGTMNSSNPITATYECMINTRVAKG